jgi:diguanylate cyclase (GGDEF)-like protein
MGSYTLNLTRLHPSDPQIQRQFEIHTAFTNCSHTLLASATTPEERSALIARALEPLRAVAHVGRASLWRNEIHAKLGLAATQIAEVCIPDLQTIQSYTKHRRPRFAWSIVSASQREALSAGVPYGGLASELYQSSPQSLALLQAIGSRALQIFPIILGDQWWGVLAFHDLNERLWDSGDLAEFQRMAELFGHVLQRWETEDALRASEASHRAMAIEHARMYQAARQQSQMVETIRQASAIVAATLDREEMIPRVLAQLARVISYDTASVQLRDGDVTEVVGSSGFANPELILGFRLPITAYERHAAIYERQEPQLITDTAAWPEFINPPLFTIRSWLGLPLIVGDQVIGMLTLDSRTTDHFTAEHVEIGMVFANQVAIALHHAQLYQREVQARARLTTLQHAVRAIVAESTSLPRMYAAVHRAVEQLMPAEAFVITLLNPHRPVVEHVYLADHAGVAPPDQDPLPGSFAEFMVHHARSLRIDDFARFTDHQFQIFGDPTDTHSGLAALIRSATRTHGLLFTQSYATSAYTDDDLAILELLAAHVATAIETAQLFAEVERLATTDSLTGLLNRRAFFLHAHQELALGERTNQPTALLMLDVDHFKQTNDTYGHQVGDRVLTALAHLLQITIRTSDIAARYGGEELIALLPRTGAAAAARVAERVRAAIAANRVTAGEQTIAVTVSVGVAVTPRGRRVDLDRLLTTADEALYQAKQRGRNQIVRMRHQP